MIGSKVRENNHLPTPRDEKKSESEDIILEGDKDKYIFNENSVIGRGAFGKIFKAKRKSDGRIVAIKKTEYDENYEHMLISNSTMREISILASLKHKNLIKYYNIYYILLLLLLSKLLFYYYLKN